VSRRKLLKKIQKLGRYDERTQRLCGGWQMTAHLRCLNRFIERLDRIDDL
jgi:hypothetical protein